MEDDKKLTRGPTGSPETDTTFGQSRLKFSHHRTEEVPKYTIHTDENYDFRAHRTNVHKPINLIEAIANLVKACLGGGLMGIHEGYMKAGIWSALVTNIVFLIILKYCTYLIVKSAHITSKRLHIPQMSYPDLAEAVLATGPFIKARRYSMWFRYGVDFAIMVNLFGACAVYMIIIGKSIKQVVEGAEELATEDLNGLRLYIAALLIPFLLIGMILSLKYLAPFSLLANFCIVICVISTIYYAMKDAPPLSERPAFKNIVSYIEFCGIVVFSMEGVGVALPVENTMDKPEKFHIAIIFEMILVGVIVAATGFFGYWGFGEECRSPVTLNFPMSAYPTILKCVVAAVIYITFAINFWAPFNLAWHYISKKLSQTRLIFWERIFRAIIITFICGVAILFPNIGNLMGLLGAFCVSCTAFIYPPIIEIIVLWEKPGMGTMKWILWKDVLLILFGIMLFVSGTYFNAIGLVSNV